ncbi:MAG: hypothetical protein K2P78_02105 [Gemmataceae bacterium]|nr:hypothetical protein [Gemmataceae bacterium]
MPRPRTPVRVPSDHKGRAVLDVNDGGVRRTRSLGPWRTPEADAEYCQFLAAFAAAPRPPDPGRGVRQRIPGSIPQVHQHHDLYGHAPAREFGPLALKAVRQRMIDHGLCHTLANRRVGRVKRAFKWAVSEELVPDTVHHALPTATGLRRGRTTAREAGPVPDAHVDAVRPHPNRHVRGLVEFQRLTGCRQGEACAVRPPDVDTAGATWYYRPGHHETAHRGRPRAIAIGPNA